MEFDLPLFQWGKNFVCWVDIAAQPLGSTPFRVFCIYDITGVIKLDDIGENRVDLFKRRWFFHHH